MKGALLGCGDLLRALRSGDEGAAAHIAAALGLEPEVAPRMAAEPPSRPAGEGPAAPVSPAPSLSENPLLPVPFWQPLSLELLDEATRPADPEEEGGELPVWTAAERPAPAEFRPLAGQRELAPRLHRAMEQRHLSRRLDVAAIVRHLGRGERLHHLPRERRRGWGARLHLIDDRSDRLIPYWQDHDALVAWLIRRYPGYGVEYAALHDGMAEPRLLRGGPAGEGEGEWRPPPPGSVVLCLSDLGALDLAPARPFTAWQRLGRRLRAAGLRPLVLTAAPTGRYPFDLARLFRLLPWQRHPGSEGDPEARRAGVERLLDLLAPAVRIEPGLLRAVRTLPGNGDLDAALEAELWQHPELASHSSVAATLEPKSAARRCAALAEQWEGLPEALRRQWPECLRRRRARLPAEIWFEEVWRLPEGARAALPAAEREKSARFLKAVGRRLEGKGASPAPAGALAWGHRLDRRLPPELYRHPELGVALQRLSYALHRDDPHWRPDPNLDPANIEATPGEPVRTLRLGQRGGRLAVEEVGEVSPAGSPIALLEARSRVVRLEWGTGPGEAEPLAFGGAARWSGGLALPVGPATLTVGSDRHRLTLRRMTKPEWADAIGRDRFGLWAEFVLPSKGKEVRQSRPIPPVIRWARRDLPPSFWLPRSSVGAGLHRSSGASPVGPNRSASPLPSRRRSVAAGIPTLERGNDKTVAAGSRAPLHPQRREDGGGGPRPTKPAPNHEPERGSRRAEGLSWTSPQPPRPAAMTTPAEQAPATLHLKTSLDHLPGPKRHQLQEIAKLFHRKVIVHYVILFGSYARGDWVEDPENR